MHTLPEILINKIMLYVSHPCADMLHNCKCERFEEGIMLNTQRKRIPNTKYHTMGFFSIRDDATEEDERRYESEVVERNIYNRFQLTCITEYYLEQLKQVNHFYFSIFTF